jgi:hypothetical protein
VNKQDQKALKQQYREAYRAFRVIVNRHDPAGLMWPDTPEDEYDSEVQLLLVRVSHAESPDDVVASVGSVFEQMFGPGYAMPTLSYQAMARELWGAWQELTRQSIHRATR